MNRVLTRQRRSPRRECLDHVIVLGKKHLHRILKNSIEVFSKLKKDMNFRAKPPFSIA